MQKGSYRRMRGTKLLKLKVTNKKGRDFPAQPYLKTFGRRDLLLFFHLSYLSLGCFVSDSVALARSIETRADRHDIREGKRGGSACLCTVA